MDKNKEFVNEALIKMFQTVGLDWDIDQITKHTQNEGWYLGHSWTAEQQDEFTDWMSAEMRKRLKVSEKAADREIMWFILNYGWTVSD